MIYISTALYCEAKPFIIHFNLKKDINLNHFQVFRNDEIILIITKTGAINGAIGLTYLCSCYTPDFKDILINIGVAGSAKNENSIGSLFLCNKITEYGTKRSFYPDLLLNHPFSEKSLITYPTLLTDTIPLKQSNVDGDLVDMEGSGIYQAGITFFQPHQMYFFKIISDHLTNDIITPDTVSSWVDNYAIIIMDWCKAISLESLTKDRIFTEDEEQYLSHFQSHLKLSVSMEKQLRGICHYYKLLHGNLIESLESFLDDVIPIPCKTKNEGKKYFDQFKQRFI